MLMKLNTSGARRTLAAVALLAVIAPISLAQAQGRGNGGGGGDGGGDGGGPGPGDTPLAFIINANDDKAPPCTANYCGPKITYILKKDTCEIRICEIEDGVRQCSTRMDDIKVCATKRS
jgi:hypothetical protein